MGFRTSARDDFASFLRSTPLTAYPVCTFAFCLPIRRVTTKCYESVRFSRSAGLRPGEDHPCMLWTLCGGMIVIWKDFAKGLLLRLSTLR